jgi:hypothetical protein
MRGMSFGGTAMGIAGLSRGKAGSLTGYNRGKSIVHMVVELAVAKGGAWMKFRIHLPLAKLTSKFSIYDYHCRSYR